MKNKSKIIVVGSDHGALDLKNCIRDFLETHELVYKVIDVGTYSSDSVDFPDFADKVVNLILENKDYLGVLCCGTGIGVSIRANRYKNIRAALVYDTFTATMAKQHNNANVICLGGRTTSMENAKNFTNIWLEGTFEAGRHLQRISKLDK
ncbi:ribose 5-phosphate isomerase B [Candidatus Marinamargulisbacteria bacterium SCGC AG-410-N11]|nr:ribose 5-phosphate isomerase B [Candidatus Marinamargulisbacteria bacterium SCGC AG-410-N11]